MSFPLRPVTYLVNHGVQVRRCSALLRAGFSATAELEHARDEWKREHQNVTFAGFLHARDIGEAAAEGLLAALDAHRAGRTDFPERYPFEKSAARYRARVLDGETPHWTPLGTMQDVADREGLSENSTGSLLRLLKFAGFGVLLGRTVYAIDPSIPYDVEWDETVPAAWRGKLHAAVELLRHNVALGSGWLHPFPMLALNGVGGVQWDHERRVLRVLSVDERRFREWQPGYWVRVSRELGSTGE